MRFGTTWDPAVAHRVEVATAGDFARSRLGADPLQGLSVIDWLVLALYRKWLGAPTGIARPERRAATPPMNWEWR